MFVASPNTNAPEPIISNKGATASNPLLLNPAGLLSQEQVFQGLSWNKLLAGQSPFQPLTQAEASLMVPPQREVPRMNWVDFGITVQPRLPAGELQVPLATGQGEKAVTFGQTTTVLPKVDTRTPHFVPINGKSIPQTFFLKENWGPILWAMLHGIAPFTTPSTMHKLFQSLEHSLPCSCKANLGADLGKMESLMSNFPSSGNAVAYVRAIHGLINQRLGKNSFVSPDHSNLIIVEGATVASAIVLFIANEFQSPDLKRTLDLVLGIYESSPQLMTCCRGVDVPHALRMLSTLQGFDHGMDVIRVTNPRAYRLMTSNSRRLTRSIRSSFMVFANIVMM